MGLFHRVLDNKHTIYSEWLQSNIKCLSDSTFVIPDKYQYEIMQVTEEYIARPDLLVKSVYGSNEYTDIICKLNGISNPFELNKGMLLVMPSPDCLLNFVKTASTKDSDENARTTNASKPKPKKKNSPRKANEAIISDIRFKIDKTNNVIVY